MAKKSPQWLLDRAFNLTSDNEVIIQSILKNLNRIEKDGITYEEALLSMQNEGAITSIDRYNRSTQTLLKSIGLITDRDKLSETGKAYIDGVLRYKDVLLLQTFKKQYNAAEGAMVRPLVIILSVLLKAYKDEANYENAWVDTYDYLNILTEISDYSELDSMYGKFIADKSKTESERSYDDVKDWDVWCSLFISTGLLVPVDLNVKYKIKLNDSEIDMIEFIIENHNKVEMLTSQETWLTDFGKISIGFSEIIPYFNRKPVYSFGGIKEEALAEIFYYTLVEGKTTRDTDDIVLKLLGDAGEGKTRGFVTQNVLNAYGIPAANGEINPDTCARGMFKAFKSYLPLLRLSSCYDKCKDIIELLIVNSSICNPVEKLSYLCDKGKNLIYYGTPGCGKSHKVKDMYCHKLKDGKKNYVRTIFHPDYTNSDFIGQLLPVKNGKDISYDFKIGPFTEALILAYNHLDEHVCLIIEELNRGNAAAIFGELFQLLDRDDNNCSEYGIINQYITEKLQNNVIKYDGYNYNFDEIKIPANLSIIATMNTSDQNVFVLDTAFQRRWKMEKIRNSFFIDPNFVVSVENAAELDKIENYVSEKAYKLAHLYIPSTCVTWREFVIEMNKRIVNPLFNEFSSDDKQIGIYFLNENELQVGLTGDNVEEKKKNFAEKMLKYIWDDIAKIDPEKWFVKEYDCLDKVLDGFETNNIDIFINSQDFKKLCIEKPAEESVSEE